MFCSNCIFMEKCDRTDIDQNNRKRNCKNFIDFDHFVEYNEFGKSGYEWVEMSHNRYSEDAWDFEETEWERYLREG